MALVGESDESGDDEAGDALSAAAAALRRLRRREQGGERRLRRRRREVQLCSRPWTPGYGRRCVLRRQVPAVDLVVPPIQFISGVYWLARDRDRLGNNGADEAADFWS